MNEDFLIPHLFLENSDLRLPTKSNTSLSSVKSISCSLQFYSVQFGSEPFWFSLVQFILTVQFGSSVAVVSPALVVYGFS